MEAHYFNIAFLFILNTGTIPKACRYWKQITPVNQTWEYFLREFARAHREQRILSNTASGAGYHTANVTENYAHDQLPADGGFVTDMAKLATTTSADRETVATLTKAISTLSDQLAATDIWAKSKEAEIKHLLGGRAPAVADAAAAYGPDSAYARRCYKTKNENYCW
jgi:hypothetical protein